MLSDAGALGLTLFAMRVARRPPTDSRTYGYYRAEILTALLNGATLVAIAIFILAEAFGRLRNPPEVEGPLMLAVATGGLLVNAAGLWLLHGGWEANLNIKGAWLHVLTDALGSVQAIVAGTLIWAFAWNWVDPVASVLIAMLVVYSSWTLIGQSVAVLMEGTPGHLALDEVRAAFLDLPDVSHAHDLHVWTITSGFVALSAHVTCPDPTRREHLLGRARRMLASRFDVRHTTIQVESDHSCEGTEHHVGNASR
jgi:cobalt-zinc-cadmium efflux system protein